MVASNKSTRKFGWFLTTIAAPAAAATTTTV